MNSLTGVVPPQAIDAEEAVLGAIMLESEAFSKVANLITPECFYNPQNKLIYEAALSLHLTSRPIDILTITSELRSKGTIEISGGAFYVTNLTSRVVSSANIEFHAMIIKEKYLKREAIKICTEGIKNAYDETSDVLDVYEAIGSSIAQRSVMSIGKQASRFSDIYIERIKSYEKSSGSQLTGVSSGFYEVDKITGGWQNSDLIILAARPGMGKTAFALNIARNAAVISGKPSAIFSLEMSKEQIVDRMVSAESGVYFEKIKSKNLTDYDWQKIGGIHELINSSIFIDDTSALSMQSLRAKATRLKQLHDIGFIVVDYLQLMTGDKNSKNGNREQEISSISRGLKALAKDLDVPVVALSQLSRAVENRPASMRRPLLSDLRESGAIEQDADQVVFLFRPEYYGIVEDEMGRSLIGGAEVIFAKNRHGPLDIAPLRFNGAYMKFSNLEDEFMPSQQPVAPPESKKEIILKPSALFDDTGEAPF